MGYQTGLTSSSRSPAFLGLVISFAAVLSLIADLDRPREGAISISQKAMHEPGHRNSLFFKGAKNARE
jgi:hypothetical protein